MNAGYNERDPLVIGSKRLIKAVWKLVRDKKIDARSAAADAALNLRDVIDTDWEPLTEEVSANV